jgi:hypothetical protein
MALHLAMIANGNSAPTLRDFSVAFWVVTAISLTATIWNLRFSRDAGSEISGHVECEETSEERRSAA